MNPSDFLPLSAKEFHILLALSAEPQNGYRIVQLAEDNSRGMVKLSPATQKGRAGSGIRKSQAG